jgi:hypothetical protein
MPRAAVRVALLFLPLLWAGSAWGVDPYVTEPVPALAFSELPKNISDALDPHGVRLVSTAKNSRTALCDVWWTKQVSVQKPAGSVPDVLYGGLKPGIFLGVISLLSYREDFQHHTLRPGLYTMRYAQLQQDGDDNAISPYRDFVVLSPGFSDKDPQTIVPLDELNKHGMLASHRDEPAVLSLVPVNPAYKSFPWPVADDRGFCTLQIRLQQQLDGKTSDLPLAIIIVRPMWENEGS